MPPRQVPAAYELARDGGVAADESKEDPWRCPLLARSVAAAVGGLLVLTTGVSVVATLIVPPARRRLVDQLGPTSRRQNVSVPDLRHCGLQETGSAEGRRRRIEPHRSTDRLAGRGRGRVRASVLAVHIGRLRSGAHTRGLVVVHPGVRGPAERRSRVIVYLAAASGLIIVSLQIAYLPTLCGAFNRRETEVALLNARSGVPSWGPELLARTHYALGSGVSTLDTLLDLYARWERWAADVAESHSDYPPLVRFRSPRPLSSCPGPIAPVSTRRTSSPVPPLRLSLFQPDSQRNRHPCPRRARPRHSNHADL